MSFCVACDGVGGFKSSRPWSSYILFLASHGFAGKCVRRITSSDFKIIYMNSTGSSTILKLFIINYSLFTIHYSLFINLNKYPYRVSSFWRQYDKIIKTKERRNKENARKEIKNIRKHKKQKAGSH